MNKEHYVTITAKFNGDQTKELTAETAAVITPSRAIIMGNSTVIELIALAAQISNVFDNLVNALVTVTNHPYDEVSELINVIKTELNDKNEKTEVLKF